MRNSTAAAAGPKARITSGGGGPTSRRSTRSAGTRASCSSGGSAKPASTATAVTNPIASGARLTWRQLGSASRLLMVRSSHSCARNPMADPMAEASSASAISCNTDIDSVKARVAPRVFSSATASRWRLHIPPRRHRDGDRTQQHADQAREAQEATGAIHGTLELGTRSVTSRRRSPWCLWSSSQLLKSADWRARRRTVPRSSRGCPAG